MLTRSLVVAAVLFLGSGCLGSGESDGASAPLAVEGPTCELCAASVDPAAEDAETGPGADTGFWETMVLDAPVTVNAANLGLNTLLPGEGTESLEVAIGWNATALVAELEWRPTGQFSLVLTDPSFCPRGAGTPQDSLSAQACQQGYELSGTAPGAHRGEPAGDARQRIEMDAGDVHAPAPCSTTDCKWLASAHADYAIQSSFLLAVTVFYGMEPPEDFSALGEGR